MPPFTASLNALQAVVERRLAKVLDRVVDQVEVEIDDRDVLERLRAQYPESRVCYVMRYPSVLERMLLRRIARKQGLPEVKNDDIVFLRPRSAVEWSFTWAKNHRNAVRAQLEKLLGAPKGTIFIPVKLFAGFGPHPLPKRLRFIPDIPFLPLVEIWTLFVLWLYRKALLLQVGSPLISEEASSSAHFLNYLSRALYKKERRVRGSPMHKAETIDAIILSGPEYEDELERVAAMESASLAEVAGRARSILHEIAATYRRSVIGVMRALLQYTFTRIFTTISVTGLERLRPVLEEHPVVLVPRHRSHLDYLLFSHVLFHNGLALPYIAAGDNLNIPGVGWLLRSSGGFFIRRKIDRDPLYKFVLERYLTYLMKQGHEIEFFIEGGRSRTGFVLRPRFGILKYLTRAVEQGARRDVVFVPVGVTYERVPEDRSLTAELAGHRKTRESLKDLKKLPRLLSANLGSASIVFGEPLSLQAHFSPSRVHERERSSREIEEIGTAIARHIALNSPLSLRSVIALAWTALGKARVSEEELRTSLDAHLTLLAADGCRPWIPALREAEVDAPILSPELREAATRTASERELKEALQAMWDLVPTETGLELSSAEYLRLFFYRNSALGWFLSAALSRYAHEKNFSEYLRVVHELFGKSLLLPSLEEWQAHMEGTFLSSRIVDSPVSQLLCPPILLRREVLRIAAEHGYNSIKRSYVIERLADVEMEYGELIRVEVCLPHFFDSVIDTIRGVSRSSDQNKTGDILLRFDPERRSEYEQEAAMLSQLVLSLRQASVSPPHEAPSTQDAL